MKNVCVLCGSLLLCLSLSVSADPLIIKFSHVSAPDSIKGRAVEKFKQLAEERTQGKVKVEVYPSGQLYKDADELEALKQGKAQMLAPSLSKFSRVVVPEFELFDLPYLFPNATVLHRVLDGMVGLLLLSRLDNLGMMGLAYWDAGFKQMSANRPLHSMADFKGLRMRHQSSPVLDAEMKALGAIPQVMTADEFKSALKQGAVDGTEITIPGFYAQKLYEAQKHMTISNHGVVGFVVVINMEFWDALPSNVRFALGAAMKEATAFERVLAQQENEEALGKLRASKSTEIYVLSESERDEWRKALLPIHAEFEKIIGKTLLKKIYDVAAQEESERQKQANK